MYKILRFIFAAVIAVSSFFGIPVFEEETGLNTVAAEITEFSGKSEIVFDKQKVNTVEIELETAAPAEVKICNNNEQIYHRSSSDAYRFCAFENM